jgi:hypothetical protein
MSERSPSALDKEQMQGLVSMPIPSPETTGRPPRSPLASVSLGYPAHERGCDAGSRAAMHPAEPPTNLEDYG